MAYKVLRASLKTFVFFTSTLALLHPDSYWERRVSRVFRDALKVITL
jgi:hypothetical protein